ncbi:MAG TPA: hypothetical protein VFN26_08350 [Candidatus Acidoferrum sp.]|nr:hypothetical protein [Candidatus Acidoferrum sp.]
MIHLALEVLAFLFLAWVAFWVFLVVVGILGAVGDKITGKRNQVASDLDPGQAKPQTSIQVKPTVTMIHGCVTERHDPRTCPVCLGAGHPASGAGGQQKRERQIEVTYQRTEYKHIAGLPWGDPNSYVPFPKDPTPGELERAREALHEREIQRRERDAQASLERETKMHDDEKREQQARDYLRREAERVLKEREGRALSEKITMGKGVVIHLESPIKESVERGEIVMVGLIIYDMKRDELRCLPPDQGIAKDCWNDILLKFLVPKPKTSASPE